MSQNHNNIYSILGKLESLTPVVKTAEAPSLKEYAEVEARGSVLEGVDAIEAKLKSRFVESQESCNECGLAEAECTCVHESSGSGSGKSGKSGKVYRHKGNYGNEYDPGEDDEKKPKKTVNKGVKGRPKKERPPEYKAPKGDIFGRTTGSVPKGKGEVVKGKAMSHPVNNRKDEARIMEGINFAEMVKHKHQSVDEMLAELQADIKTFKESGSCSDLLRDCMEVVSYGKQQIADEAITRPSPTDIKFATPAVQRKAAAPAGDKSWMIGQADLDQKERETPTTHAGLQQRKQDLGLAEELDELAKLAGLKVSEGNDGNLANNAKPYDKVTRGDVIAGRLGKDEMGGDDVEEANDGNLANNAKPYDKVTRGDVIAGRLGKDEEGGKNVEECMSPMGSAPAQQSRINVSTNISSDGNKNVSVTADGEEAEALMQMLAMAGLVGGKQQAQKVDVVAVAEAKKEYGDTDVEEVDAEELANAPDEQYGTVNQIKSQGDDLNRQKKQFKREYPGDNPMAVESALSLEERLAAEYESIKKVSK